MTLNAYTSASRIGFHYYPDTVHYSAAHLHTWLPVLQGLDVGWLVIKSENTRAIPEQFLTSIVQAGIKPIIELDGSLLAPPQPGQLHTLLDVYARWGARYISFFQQPNARSAWPGTGWAQQDLVERFLDRFLPVAQSAVDAGLQPVFPALAPGGSYWDTAFLRAALEMMERRKALAVLDGLVLSAYAWTGGKRLDWGAGGPQKWPQARPYCTPPGSEDQRGFHIYEWYQAAACPILGADVPILLLQAGLPGAPAGLAPAETRSEQYTHDCLEIARAVNEVSTTALPKQVLAASFWLLSAEKNSPAASQAWFPEDGPPHALAARLQALRRQRDEQRGAPAPAVEQKRSLARPIGHYLLLPGGESGVSDWTLEVIRPFLKKHRPTVGFSPREAERAARVTIVGSAQQYPAGLLERLQSSGCKIDQIQGTGTDIASILAER